MAYNAYASIGPPPLPGAGQADGQSMYAPNQGHWLFKAGANDESDMSWEQIERTRARLLENIVKSSDKESVDDFKKAQETIADEEAPKDFTTKIMPLLAVKKGGEADSAGNKTKKLLSSMISVKKSPRERPSDSFSPESTSKKMKVGEDRGKDGGGKASERHLDDEEAYDPASNDWVAPVEKAAAGAAGAAAAALSALADYSDSDQDQ